MPFQNDTNHGRVQKIIEILGLIEKSATSNNVSMEEVTELLKPLLDGLAPFLPQGNQEAPEPAQKVSSAGNPIIYEPKTSTYPPGSFKDYCEKLSGPQLCNLVYVAMLQIEETVYKNN